MTENGATNGAFAPDSVVFENYTKVLAAAKKHAGNGQGMILDMEKTSDNFDSAAVCLILELMRDAHDKNHPIEILNINGRLKKLLHLYQLTPLVVATTSVSATSA